MFNTTIMLAVKPNEKKQAIQMLVEGFTQRQIALKLKVTEKTVGVWKKENADYIEQRRTTIKNLRNKLENLSADPNSNIDDILKLSAAIEKIERSHLNPI